MLITSEYVSYGHPDKVADQISDAILDEYLSKDRNARCGIETLIKDNVVVLGGEVNSVATVDHAAIARTIVDGIGYPYTHNLNKKSIKVIDLIGQQSPEIHEGVDRSDGEIGAGDQGFVVGFATDETEEMLPLGVYIAKKICQYVAGLTECGYGPDVKTQVIVEYNEEKKAERIHSILVSTMHDEQKGVTGVRDNVERWIRTNEVELDKAIFDAYITNDTPINVNPLGDWHVGGPISDCGVTGRKIVVDQYGGYCNVGGGGWSGKDMTKVDRSAAYMARYIAKNIVATRLVSTAKVEIAYTIGEVQPTAVNITLTGKQASTELENAVKEWIMGNISLTPAGIMEMFEEPVYYAFYSRNGHYGYTPADKFCPPWEFTDWHRVLKNHLEEHGWKAE